MVTMKAKTNTFGSTYRINYPGQEAYHFPAGSSKESPCMNSFWRGQPMREGIRKEE